MIRPCHILTSGLPAEIDEIRNNVFPEEHNFMYADKYMFYVIRKLQSCKKQNVIGY